jgi:hypothetical protein
MFFLSNSIGDSNRHRFQYPSNSRIKRALLNGTTVRFSLAERHGDVEFGRAFPFQNNVGHRLHDPVDVIKAPDSCNFLLENTTVVALYASITTFYAVRLHANLNWDCGSGLKSGTYRPRYNPTDLSTALQSLQSG